MNVLKCLLLLFFFAGNLWARPNVLFIAVDDLRDWVGHLGGHPNAKTPNIDRLSVEGRKFTSFMVASPVCTPSRAALLTGCYPKRVGMHQHVLFPSSIKGLNPKEHTLADHLKSEGYATACNHLGGMPPIAVCGLSLLYLQSHCVASSWACSMLLKLCKSNHSCRTVRLNRST